jgi:DNA-binding transcriptional ArsR family regulator
MRRGAGDAMRMAVAAKPRAVAQEVKGARTALLSSGARRTTLEFLCAHPCSSASQAARKLGVSLPTAQWHLGKLQAAGYLGSSRKAGTEVYHPAGLYSGAELEVCAFFSKSGRPMVYRDVVSSPGKTAGEIALSSGLDALHARSSLQGLVALGLVSEIRDGRHKRYYPTSLFEDLNRKCRKNWRLFRDRIMQKLQEERLSPALKRASPEGLLIGIIAGRDAAQMYLRTELRSVIEA